MVRNFTNNPVHSPPSPSLSPGDVELGLPPPSRHSEARSSVSKADGDDAIGGHVEAALEKGLKSEGADATELVGGTTAMQKWMLGGGSGGFWSMSYICINFVQNFTLVSLFDVSWPASWKLSIKAGSTSATST